ncbi:ribonuclease P protein component [bacterium]|nr:ribonuclease P protein component [bacterium]
MFAKKHRLTKQKDFEKVFKTGRLIFGRFLFLKILKNSLKYSRFAFIVSNKISKKAIIRNKIKRRMRAIVKKHFNEIKLEYDIIIIAKSGIETLGYEDLDNAIYSLIRKHVY